MRIKIIRLYNLSRLKILKEYINLNKKYIKEIKLKSLYLKRKNLPISKFQKSINNSLNLIKLDIGYLKIKKKLNLNIFTKKLEKIIMKITTKNIIKKLKNYRIKIIKIQSHIRKNIAKKKYNKLKEKLMNKLIKIQKRIKGILIRKNYKNELLKIKENIRFNKRKKEFERKMKLMKKKKAAVRIIEKYWLKVLERREEMDLEEILKKIPEECRDLYKKLILLRKETRNLKKDVDEFGEKEREKRLKDISLKKFENKPQFKFK